MNYYERHLGDYARDTAHLTMMEHGAYNLLLDRYYTTEEGIPAVQVHRLTRARTKDERKAVDAVLGEFFTLVDGAWTHRRAEEEIAKAQVRIKAAKENGKLGGRRRLNQNETQDKPDGFLTGSKYETESKAHQAPDTKHQTPDTKHHVETSASDNGMSTARALAGTVCARLKQDGVQGVNPQHPTLLRLLQAGLTTDEIISIGPEAVQKNKPFAWLLAAAEGRRRDAATVGKLPGKAGKPWFMSWSGIEHKAAELGITKMSGERDPDFKARVLNTAGVTDDMVRRADFDSSYRTPTRGHQAERDAYHASAAAAAERLGLDREMRVVERDITGESGRVFDGDSAG